MKNLRANLVNGDYYYKCLTGHKFFFVKLKKSIQRAFDFQTHSNPGHLDTKDLR